MENRFNNRDFEQFVKQNADQYRMFPSEKVWNNIHTTLHVRRRWYGFGIALLFISVTAVTLVMVNHPAKNQPVAQTIPAPTANSAATTPEKTEEVFIAPSRPSAIKASSGSLAKTEAPVVFLSEFDQQPLSDYTTAISASEEDKNIETVVAAQPPVSAAPVASLSRMRSKEVVLNNLQLNEKKTVSAEPSKAIFTTVIDNSNITPVPEPVDYKTAAVADANLLTIESVINSYKYRPKPKRLSFQAFVTPTISYRDLKENKAFLQSLRMGNATPLTNVYVPDINSIVTHKPDLGFQLGLTAGYPLTKSLTLIGGLQFTVSKYDIKAYSSPTEQTTIALSSTGGGSNTVSTITNYRNIGGYKANWLRNLYVSASIPVGLELKIAGNKRGYAGVAGTIQPTYVLDNSSYLLSTDYKNYAELPSLVRKWNINAGFEIFVANNTGKVKWRLGPQARYQTMSSFVNKYPVKEHLFDFGLKLGIMLR